MPVRLEPSVSSQALYHWATALPLNPYCKIHFQLKIPSTTGRKLKNRAVPGGGGFWYFHLHVGSGHFLASEILNFIIFVVFRKMIFWYEDFLNMLRGHHKIGLYLRSFLYILRSFLTVNVQHGGIWVGKTSNIILGAWNSWYFKGKR